MRIGESCFWPNNSSEFDDFNKGAYLSKRRRVACPSFALHQSLKRQPSSTHACHTRVTSVFDCILELERFAPCQTRNVENRRPSGGTASKTRTPFDNASVLAKTAFPVVGATHIGTLTGGGCSNAIHQVVALRRVTCHHGLFFFY